MFFITIFAFLGLQAQGQRYLQIEELNKVETIRFREGDKIQFRTKEFPKDWQKGKIEKIIVEDNLILLQNSMLNLEDITKVRVYKSAPDVAGKVLMVFGGVWLTYGVVALVFGLPNVVASDLIIGGVAVIVGWVTTQFSRQTFTIGKKAQLRIIDITFP